MKKKNVLRFIALMVSSIFLFTTNSLLQCLPYIVQTPPGINPEKFAPNNSYLANSSWFYHGSPVFSPDGNEMHFVKYFTNGDIIQIWYTKCDNGQWIAPQKASFSTSNFDNNPFFSQSNDTLYFQSRRGGGFIFRVTRTPTGWSEPVALNIPLPPNSIAGNQFSMTKNKTIYFEIWGANFSTPPDIYRTKLIDGQYSQPENIGAPINTSIGEGVGYVDPDEKFMIYFTFKADGYGMHDMYISSMNQDGTWNTPKNLGSKINTSNEDSAPFITPDGKYFFFTTIKAGDQGYTPYWVDAKVIYDLIKDTTNVTDYDGNTYKTVKIGNQIWMAENLRSTHYSDGTPISHFEYDNDSANVSIYGRLYSSQAVMKGAISSNINPSNVQGIAPDGWHLPSKAEWQELADYLGGLEIAGGKLKEAGTTHWIAPNTGATNETGFTALPAGMHDFTGIFQWKSENCAFSTSTGNPRQFEVISIVLRTTESKMTIGEFHPDDAASVRCIKNDVVDDVKDEHSQPTGYNLFQNYPNPFNPSTTIMYTLKIQSHVKLSIINILGETVVKAVDEIKEAGAHEYFFNASDLTSGIYFCQLTTGDFLETKKMILLR